MIQIDTEKYLDRKDHQSNIDTKFKQPKNCLLNLLHGTKQQYFGKMIAGLLLFSDIWTWTFLVRRSLRGSSTSLSLFFL